MKKWILLIVLILVLTGISQAIPDPSAVYCILQGYDLETRTDEQGNQYGVCVFPDGSECSTWAYYCKCEPNGIGCSPGVFSCHWPCEEMRCKEAGESVLVSTCCEGLDEIYPAYIFDANCNNLGMVGWLFLCSDCGNGFCESWESRCNCPADCAQPLIIYVDADANGLNDGSSWADAYNGIQDALAIALPGDEIWVAQGIYRPAGPSSARTATFQLKNGVVIKGDYAGFDESEPNVRDIQKYETVLSGDLNGNNVLVANLEDLLDEPTRAENCYHVVTGSGTDLTAVFDGFTITGGNANGIAWPNAIGGGMRNSFGSPTVLNCTFRGNSAKCGGGMTNYWSSPTLTNCTIFANLASGPGGGMYNAIKNPTVVACIFNGNSSGGYGGGMCNATSSPILTNCAFTNNSAENGGGVYNCEDKGPAGFEPSDPTLTNCTFTGNSARHGGGMFNTDESSPILTNCILWGDTSNEVTDEFGCVTLITYSNVQGGWPGKSNINDDPCFVDSGYWDVNNVWFDGHYHLLPDSPCIDSGDPNYIAEPNETDLDGKPRIINGRIDMGVYEFNHIPISDAGPDREAYAWIDGIAELTLDGTASFDNDGQPLTYYWSWIVDGSNFTATEPNIAIELPVGEYAIELVVNDGIDDSEPDEVIVMVVEALESQLLVLPRTINLRSRQKYILAWVRLPEGITKRQIDTDQPLLLYPGGVEANHQYTFQSRRHGAQQMSILAFFDKSELMEAVPDSGQVELQVVGQLKTGQYFYGTNTIRIISRRRMPRFLPKEIIKRESKLQSPVISQTESHSRPRILLK